MITVNDDLRKEFQIILEGKKYSEKIKSQNLDPEIIKKAFEVLLKFKDNPDLSEKARGEFENFVINYFRMMS